MPLVSDLIDLKASTKRARPVIEAHYVESHWVHTKLPWEEAAKELVRLFPRDTRIERPKPWYRRLMGTHWPGQIPPGNGPFYVPEWTLEENEEGEAVATVLRRAGFRKVDAHGVYLPQNREYLAVAMRAAGKYPWTANPITARGYLYPTIRRPPDKKLRPYNVKQWRL